jgi:hypothetical protein
MGTCDNCQKTILWGGTKVDQFTFCGKSCAIMGQTLIESYNLPDQVVQPELEKMHQSNCPKCSGPGPVDVHYYHSIWSLIYLTQWKTKHKVSCQRCGTKARISATVFSFVFGWWGFPWGIVITPIQIGKNIKGMISPISSTRPSKDFEKLVRLGIVERRRQEKELNAQGT